MRLGGVLVVWVLLTSLLYFPSCDNQSGSRVNMSQETNRESAVVIQDEPWEKLDKLYSKSGFEVPCLKHSEVKREMSSLAHQVSVEEILTVIREPKNCNDDDFGVYRKLVGGVGFELEVVSIVSYQTKDTTFAQTVTFHIKKTNATTELTYLDTDRNGSLDTVFQSSTLAKPILPKWIVRNTKSDV